MKCCLCGGEIEIVGTWKLGNNVQPLKDGRCCGVCNIMQVIPKRLKMMEVI